MKALSDGQELHVAVEAANLYGFGLKPLHVISKRFVFVLTDLK